MPINAGDHLWRRTVKNRRRKRVIVLYGRSFDFGSPDFDYVKRIDWSGLGSTPRPLLYLPHWPDETEVIPVIAGRE